MAVVRVATDAALIEVLGRVLDKGIVFDAWDRLLAVAIDKTRLVAGSIDIQHTYGELGRWHATGLRPPIDPGTGLDELGVREPLPDPKPPRAGGAAIDPSDHHFGNDTTLVRCDGRAVILEPQGWPEGYVASFNGMPDDFTRPPQGKSE